MKPAVDQKGIVDYSAGIDLAEIWLCGWRFVHPNDPTIALEFLGTRQDPANIILQKDHRSAQDIMDALHITLTPDSQWLFSADGTQVDGYTIKDLEQMLVVPAPVRKPGVLSKPKPRFGWPSA